MDRRTFLKVLGTQVKKQVAQAPQNAVKIPKNTLGNLRELDNASKLIKANGNNISTRQSFLSKAKKKIGVLLIKNSKETTKRLGDGLKALPNAVSNISDPTGAALKLEGRKLSKIGKFLSKFNKNSPKRSSYEAKSIRYL
jgi:hypothetical protein